MSAEASSAVETSRSRFRPKAPTGLWRIDLAVIFVAALVANQVARLGGVDYPDYLDVLLAFLLLLVIPGAAIARLLAPSSGRDLIGTLVLAIPFGVLSLVPATAISFAFELPMETFLGIALGTGGALVLAAATPLAQGPRMRYSVTPGEETLLMVLFVIVLTPVWLRVDLSRDFDDWWYLGYVREYREANDLAPRDPMAGPDGPVSARAALDVWLVGEGAISRLADADPVYVVQTFLPPFLLAAFLLATYFLTKRLLSRDDAAFAAVFVVGLMAAIDLLAREGFGHSMVLRSAQDKVVAGFLALPVFLMLLYEAASIRSRRSFAALAVAGAALVVIHPIGLVLAFTGAVGFAALEIGSGAVRSVSKRRAAVALGVLALLVALPATAWWRIADESPALFDAETGPRLEYRVIDLPGDLYMAHPGLLRNPVLLLALATSLLFVKRWKQDRAARLILAATWMPVIVMFFPPTATLAGNIVSPSQLWRFLWLIPAGTILGYAAIRGAEWLRPEIPQRLAMTCSLGVIAIAGLVGAEANAATDPGYYAAVDVDRDDQNVSFVRGVRYLFDGSQRLTDGQVAALRAIGRIVPAGERVVADVAMSRAINAFAPGVIPFAVAATPRTDSAARDRDTLLEDGTPPNLRRAILERHGLTYFLAPAASEAYRSLAFTEGVRDLYRTRPYILTRILPATGLATPAATFDIYQLWRARGRTDGLRSPRDISLGTTWTATKPVDTSNRLIARLTTTDDTVVEESVVNVPDVAGAFPFNHRFFFAVPQDGQYRIVVTVDRPGVTSSYEAAVVRVSTGAQGRVRVVFTDPNEPIE